MNERNAHDDTKRTLTETRRDLAAAREAHEDTIKAMQASSSGGEEQRSALTGTRRIEREGGGAREIEREREKYRVNDILLYRLHVISQVPFTYMTLSDSKQVISLLHLFPRHPTPHTTHPLPLHTRVTGELAHTKSLYQDALGRHERDHAAIDRLEREATEGEAARGKIKEVQ